LRGGPPHTPPPPPKARPRHADACRGARRRPPPPRPAQTSTRTHHRQRSSQQDWGLSGLTGRDAVKPDFAARAASAVGLVARAVGGALAGTVRANGLLEDDPTLETRGDGSGYGGSYYGGSYCDGRLDDAKSVGTSRHGRDDGAVGLRQAVSSRGHPLPRALSRGGAPGRAAARSRFEEANARVVEAEVAREEWFRVKASGRTVHGGITSRALHGRDVSASPERFRHLPQIRRTLTSGLACSGDRRRRSGGGRPRCACQRERGDARPRWGAASFLPQASAVGHGRGTTHERGYLAGCYR